LDKIAKLKQAPVQPPPLESFPKVGYCQDCGEPAYETPSGTVCKNGHGGAEVVDQPPKKEEPKKEEPKPVEAPSASKTSKAIDFSSIDPEKEWECFGTIVKDHPECKECPFATKCEEKKNAKAKK
jgi:hypothetical protein